MVYKKENMTTSVRSNLKGGEGDISFINFADCTDFKNCRLLSQMTIPVGGSIGEHTHINESEYYIITEGNLERSCRKSADGEKYCNIGADAGIFRSGSHKPY